MRATVRSASQLALACLVCIGSASGFPFCVPARADEVSKPLEITTETEDINITYDTALAREQVKKYPDNPEAHFVLAVALTRSSLLEDAFKEIRIARRLAQKQGGPEYFNGMIEEYEKILLSSPGDNRIRYHLAWGYYMKAYLLAEYSRRVMVAPAKAPEPKHKSKKEKGMKVPVRADHADSGATRDWHGEWVASAMESGKVPEQTTEPEPTKKTSSSPLNQLTAMEQVMKKAAPSAIPQIKKYYQSALSNLDDLLAKEPQDVWARLYRAHLNAEYTGNLDAAMAVWSDVSREHPTNPAAYFFLGEGYLKQGNLRECLTNVSKAVALRTIGN